MGTNPTFFTSWVNAFTLQYKVIVPLPVSKLFDSFTFIIRVWLKTCYMSRNIFFLVLIGMQKKCMPVSFSFLIAVQSDQTVFNTVVQQSVTEKSIVCAALFASSLLHAEAGSARSQRWMWSAYAV